MDITLWNVAIIKSMELLQVELTTRWEKDPGTIRIPISPTHKSWHTWKNLRNSLRKQTRVARNTTITKKATATQTPLEILGQVVPGKTMIVLRNLKLITN